MSPDIAKWLKGCVCVCVCVCVCGWEGGDNSPWLRATALEYLETLLA